MTRRRIYQSNAERQAAYRKRQLNRNVTPRAPSVEAKPANMDADQARGYMNAEVKDKRREEKKQRQRKQQADAFNEFFSGAGQEDFWTGTPSGGGAPSSAREQKLAAEVKRHGWRAAALQHHPDRGGTHEDMVILNRIRARGIS
jgi:hypothetical protein